MTYLQLKRKLLGDETAPPGDPRGVGLAFPLGTPDNLRPQLEEFIVLAMIEIQRYIECWQVGHIDAIPACSVMVQNGCSVLTKPDGVIEEVYTVESRNGTWVAPVPYTPTELAYLRRWMSRFRRTMKPEFTSRAGVDGFRQPSRLDDSPYGRALSGVWSIDARANRLIVGPWLQSNELLVVRWSGIKRQWADTDLVSDNPDFARLVMLWLQQEYGRAWASSDLATRIDTWAGAQADAIVECRHKLQLPVIGVTATADEVAEARAFYATDPVVEPEPVRDSTVICIVGDTGTADATAQAVAAAVAAASPDAVILAGDAVYQPNTPAAALAPYESFMAEGRLMVALGNHDLDLGIDTVAESVGNPGNGRYFNLALPFVEAFIINSGIDTSGAVIEPDGNYAGSIQSTAIAGMVARSCALWKLAVLHHPPYTSGERYWPGVASVRWASDLEVHAVVAGHSHNYERGVFRGRTHVVVGTGGRTPLDGFTSPLTGSEARLEEHGFLKVTATKDLLKLEFIGVSGTVLDSKTITGDAPMQSSAPSESDSLVYNDTIQAGTDYAIDVFIRDGNGGAIDISACTGEVQLKRNLDSPSALTLNTGNSGVVIVNGPAGHLRIQMTAIQTSALVDGTYIYALETYCPSTARPLEGTFTISPEIVT